jgi:spore maturation protein B
MGEMAQVFSSLIFLLFVIGIPLFGLYKRIDIFDSFIEGGQEGFQVVLKVIPYLVGMFVAIGMLRASGFFDSMSKILSPIFEKIGFPTEVLPLALIRPFSGSAANGIMAELIHTHGGNAFISKVAATMMGSTETTFYVVAVYFGAVGIRKTRYAIHAGLIADTVGVIAAVCVCHLMFG